MELNSDVFGIAGWIFGLLLALGSYRQGKSNAVGSLAEATSTLLDPLIARIKSLEVQLKDCLKEKGADEDTNVG